jgi:adenylate cyclase
MSNDVPALVLIVDDDEVTRDGASECLSDSGYRVRVASNGFEALDALATIRPDLIIIDWRMPVMSGEELLASLQADASLATIPVIVMTASHARDIAAGHATILHKPVRMKALLDAVRSRLAPRE